MIRPRRDLTIAVVLLIVSIPAFLNGLPGILRNEASWSVGIAVVAALVGFFSVFMTFNFLSALRISLRLERGEGVLARWTVPAESVAAFRREETHRARNHWRPRVDAAVEIIFGQEVVLVDGGLYSLPSAGMQSVRAVRLLPSDPPSIEFDTLLVAAVGSPSARTIGATPGVLRLPAPDRRAAATVLHHFQDMLAGRTIVAPTRWTSRIRAGMFGMVMAAAAGVIGYLQAEANGWRGDVPYWWVPLVLLITAPLLGAGSLALAIVAAVFRRQQRGQR